MSVTEDVVLPAQPTVGGTFNTPLGGDGFLAPIHRTDADMTLTGDASAGVIRHRFVLDRRHCHILNWMSITAADPAADTQHIVTMSLREGIQLSDAVTATYFAFGATQRSRTLWRPPSVFIQGGTDPEVQEPYIQVSTNNVNGLDVKVTVQLLAFDVESVRVIPYGQLVQNQPFA